MSLHLPTLMTVCIAALATSAAVMTLHGLTQRTYRGYGWWVAAQWLLALGCVLHLFRDRAPELLPLGNLLLLQWPIVVLAGMRRFCLRHASRVPPSFDWLLLALAYLVWLAAWAAQGSLAARVAAYAAGACALHLYSALMLVRITGYGTMLMAFGRTNELMRIQIAGMVVNVSASFFLLPRIGMIAAPLGAVFTQLSMIVMILMRVDAQARVGIRGIFPWSHWLRTVLAAAIAATLAGFVLWWLSARVPVAIQLVACLLTFAIPYVICANVFGVLTAEDRVFIRRWVRLEPLRNKPNP